MKKFCVVLLIMTMVFSGSMVAFAADIYEYNNTTYTATTVTSYCSIYPTIDVASDVDYFKFTLTSSHRVDVLECSPYNTNYVLSVYNSSGTLLGTDYLDPYGVEHLTLNLSAGTYYIKVSSYDGTYSSSVYNLIYQCF